MVARKRAGGATKTTRTKRTRPKPRQGAKASTPPWERDKPKKHGAHKRLSPKAKASAKASARKAGRPYPNLVDNMRAASADEK